MFERQLCKAVADSEHYALMFPRELPERKPPMAGLGSHRDDLPALAPLNRGANSLSLLKL